jgi:hypothetical protein
MLRHRLFTMDFIFLGISIILMAWMGLSYFMDSKVNSDYATTVKVRPGYEIRDYENNTLVGAAVELEGLFWWKEVDRVKTYLLEQHIGFIDYPYFIRENQDGLQEIFFITTQDQEEDTFDGLLVASLPQHTAFSEFKWYPTKKAISKAKAIMFNALIENSQEYDDTETWIEVRNTFITIPFMMQSGVFSEIE